MDLVKKNNVLIVARDMVENKPRLAIAVEQRKIRDYSNETMIPVMKNGEEVMVSELQHKQEGIITYLLMLLGITETKEKEKIEHYAMLDIFIQEEYGEYTYEEIKEAFKMAIKGEFDEFNFKLIHKLDAKIFGEIMKYYTIIRNRKLRIYNEQVVKNIRIIEEERMKPTKEETDKIVFNAIIDEYNNFKKEKKISAGRIYLYDILFKKGLLPKDKKTKEAVCEYAKEKFKTKRKLAINKKERMMYQILDANGKNTTALINYCKEISLERFFSLFNTQEQLIQKL